MTLCGCRRAIKLESQPGVLMRNSTNGQLGFLNEQPTSSETAGKEVSPSSQISSPTISLPKGGGAIRGIGEKFSANPVTGTGSISVPVAVSPGRSGFGPQLTL